MRGAQNNLIIQRCLGKSWVQPLIYSKAWLLLRLAEDLAGCAGKQNARVGGWLWLPWRFQRKAEEGMQCGAESDFLQQAPGKDMCDPVRVQLKPHQRPQHVGDARMLNIRLGKLQAAREPAQGPWYGLQLKRPGAHILSACSGCWICLANCILVFFSSMAPHAHQF